MENRSKIPRSVRGRYRFSISLGPLASKRPRWDRRGFSLPVPPGKEKGFLRDLCVSVVKVNSFTLCMGGG